MSTDDTPPTNLPAERTPKRRRGPAPRPAAELRRHRVSVYLTDAELSALVVRVFPGQPVDGEDQGVRQQIGRYMRDAAFDRLPPQIPAINREAWVSLAGVAGNLNRYQAALEVGNAHGYPSELVAELRDQVQALRRQLLGVEDILGGEGDE